MEDGKTPTPEVGPKSGDQLGQKMLNDQHDQSKEKNPPMSAKEITRITSILTRRFLGEFWKLFRAMVNAQPGVELEDKLQLIYEEHGIPLPTLRAIMRHPDKEKVVSTSFSIRSVVRYLLAVGQELVLHVRPVEMPPPDRLPGPPATPTGTNGKQAAPDTPSPEVGSENGDDDEEDDEDCGGSYSS